MSEVKVDKKPGMLQHRRPRAYITVATKIVPMAKVTVHQRRLVGKAFVADAKTRGIVLLWPDEPLTLEQALNDAVPAALPKGGHPMFGVAETGDIVQWGDPFCRGARIDGMEHAAIVVVPLLVSPATYAEPALVEHAQRLCDTLHRVMPPLRLIADVWPKAALKPLLDVKVQEVSSAEYERSTKSEFGGSRRDRKHSRK